MLAEVVEGDQKFIYVGSKDFPSLERINITGIDPEPAQIISEVTGSVFSILQDRKKTIWIGTYNAGSLRWIPQMDGTYQTTVFKKENAGSNSIIRKIYEDITVTSADEEFLKKAMAVIEDHMSDSELNVEKTYSTSRSV